MAQNSFGDVLRGLGSVLNPQVMQQAEAEDNQRQQQASKIQDTLLHQELVKQSPEYKMKLEQLKNEQGFRVAAQEAKGDPAKIAGAAMQFGKPEIALGLYKSQEDRAARVQRAHDMLLARKDALEAASREKGLDRDMKERLAAQTAALTQQSIDLKSEMANQTYELKKMQFQMQGDKDLVKNSTALGKDLEKANLPEADAVIGNVEKALKKNPEIAEYLAGPKAVLPDMVVGRDIATGRQDFQKLFNITLKNRSGSAVTNQELERLKTEFGAGAFKTSAQLKDAVEKVRDIVNKHYTSIAAGHGPEALKAYNENLRGLGGKVVIEAGEPKGGGVMRFDAQGNPVP